MHLVAIEMAFKLIYQPRMIDLTKDVSVFEYPAPFTGLDGVSVQLLLGEPRLRPFPHVL